jgi:hypothetical protein
MEGNNKENYMDALTIDMTLTKGGDWSETINLYEDDGETPQDTTGYDMVMTIKSAGGDTYDTLTVGDGITHTPALGQFALAISHTTLDTYTFATAERRVIVTDATGTKTVLIIGTVTVR